MVPENFLENLQFIHPRDIVKLIKREDRPKTGIRWVLKNEVRPVDLYCYLGARFGQPNGIQNFLSILWKISILQSSLLSQTLETHCSLGREPDLFQKGIFLFIGIK